MRTLFSILVAGLLISPTILHAVPGDEHWDAQFGWPGPGGEILSIATHNGQIYASGLFNPNTNAPIEVWNGAQWTAIGQTYGNPGMAVNDMAFVGNYLYIAGSFTNVSGVPATGLARWDGANWSSVGFSGGLNALAVSGNNLYVAGAFTNATADGALATNIASWDGASWHVLGAGLGRPGNGTILGITIQGGILYAGGAYTNSGSLLITNLAAWNGSSWSALGGPFNSAVYQTAFYGGNLIAGGVFAQIGATAATGIAQWNGSSWSTIGGGVAGGYVTRLGVVNGTLYASGTFNSAGGVAATNIAAWNGSSWSALGAGVNSAVTRLFSNVTNLYVGGAFTQAGGIIANRFATWDGSNWGAIGPSGRMNGLSFGSVTITGDGTNLYAGGLFTAAGQTSANLVARFDGTNWYPLGSGIGPVGGLTIVRALAVVTNGVYVGGQFNTAGGVIAQNMAFWNGNGWSAVGTNPPAGGPGGVVADMLVRPEGVYIVGASLEGSGPNYFSPIFMRWDGTNWYNALSLSNAFFAEPFNTPDITMDAIAAVGSNIYVGGRFNYAQGDQNYVSDATSCPDIFMINNGGFANLVGTGFNSNVLDMAVIGTNLYAAGYFTNAGGIAASHIAMWNGATWSTLGSGVVGNGYVDALATIGTNLYAAGTFTNIGGIAANRVARWDGITWWPLGSGALGISGLYSSGNDLYVGGGFTVAGNKPSYYIGHWNDQVNFNTPKVINPKWLGAGQFQGRLYGVPGVTNIVQATTNFTVWTPVLTNSVGIYDFTDSNSPPYPYRFYRGALSQ